MKSLSTLVLAAGLVSAVSISPSPVASEASSNGQAESVTNIFNSSASLNSSQINSADPSFDPASLNLNNIGGLNLGQVDFSNQDSVASAILSMLNVLCVGNVFDVNSILGLGVNNDLELFLELVQLMQLEQLGFLNVFDIQSLLGSGFSSSLFGGLSNSNVFNLGSFKRAVSERKKTMKRTRLRRGPAKSKRQCQAGVADPNAAAGSDLGVAAPAASAAPEVAAPPAASAAPAAEPAAAAPAAAAPAAAAPAAAAPADDGESLSDFTR